VPKAGAEADEYEDAAHTRVDAWPVRAAVADGATESIFAADWAQILVQAVTRGPITPAALREGIPDWRRAWAARRDEQAATAPWYVQAKADDGAFATLLGLEVHANGRWRAAAVGDCVLFHLRGAQLKRRWPVSAPDAFTDRPALLGSRPHPEASVPERPRTTSGEWRRGDAFLMATDAVAAWLLRAHEQAREQPEASLTPAAARTWSAEAFREAVAAARADGTLRNDDSTLLVLEWPAPPAP
jgi:hypothetical protein